MKHKKNGLYQTPSIFASFNCKEKRNDFLEVAVSRTINENASLDGKSIMRFFRRKVPKARVFYIFIIVLFILLQVSLLLNKSSNSKSHSGHSTKKLRLKAKVKENSYRGYPERKISSLKDDEHASKKRLAVDKAILHKKITAKTIQSYGNWVWRSYGTKISSPTILPPPVLSAVTTVDDKLSSLAKALCSLEPPGLVGQLTFRSLNDLPTLDEVATQNPAVLNHGFFDPAGCTARHRVAFIIPHRGREPHLRALLWHLIPILQRQQLRYKIYVVHQAGDQAFNKAKLMNLGFLEATREADFDCFVFHDVDLLPENDKLLYTCTNTPKHMSVAIDKYDYQLPYESIFGGVTMVTPKQFRDVNGYSNKYWGWGGEDDDMHDRLVASNYVINRPPISLARYKMIFHERDKGNADNLLRFALLSTSEKRIRNDGLDNIVYSLLNVTQGPLYANITAQVGSAVLQCSGARTSSWRCDWIKWLCYRYNYFCSRLQLLSTEDGTLAL